MIELKHIFLTLGSRQVLHNLSVVVPDGGRLLVRGDSGAGKSTILRLILGLARPERGEVTIHGERLDRSNVWRLRQKMAYVSQDMQLGRGRVEAFIQQVFSFRNNRSMTYNRNEVAGFFERFALEESLLEGRLEDLSGGELQRVAIITALLLKRPIYLLDEITSALDARLKQTVVDHFDGLKGHSLVIVSHDPQWLAKGYPILEMTP